MTEPNGKDGPEHAGESIDPLSEAEAVRALMAEAQTRLARLVAALKNFRRQSRALSAAMESLRRLPPLTP